MPEIVRLLADNNTNQDGSIWTTLLTFAPFVVLIAVFYFFMIRPQNKRQRETESMRESVMRGDVVTTVGGIVGVVIVVKDNNILLETSGDKTRIQVQKWAIRSIEQKAE
ncbi:MAG: preprotein translocase subunit YajC [Eubacteriales bacterium]